MVIHLTINDASKFFVSFVRFVTFVRNSLSQKLLPVDLLCNYTGYRSAISL
jgi:hypothetical protein